MIVSVLYQEDENKELKEIWITDTNLKYLYRRVVSRIDDLIGRECLFTTKKRKGLEPTTASLYSELFSIRNKARINSSAPLKLKNRRKTANNKYYIAVLFQDLNSTKKLIIYLYILIIQHIAKLYNMN